MDYSHALDRAGVPELYILYWWLQAAKADNLTPVIVLSQGVASQDNNGNSLPDANPGAYPDPSTQYNCGMYYLINTVEAWAASGNPTPYVTEWEAYNEPDSAQGFNCGTSCPNVPPATAADYYLWALNDDSYNYRGDQIAAGAFNYADAAGSGPYVSQYIAELKHYVAGAPIWSIHPYDDITNGLVTDDPSSFNRAMANNGIGITQLWLTEAADWLDNPRYPSTDGSSYDQAGDGAGFVYELTSAAPDVTQEDWYQFQATGNPGDGPLWDSGMLDGNGQPRSSYCSILWIGGGGANPGSCSYGNGPGSPSDNWSGQ
jgi:hypothetical protein